MSRVPCAARGGAQHALGNVSPGLALSDYNNLCYWLAAALSSALRGGRSSRRQARQKRGSCRIKTFPRWQIAPAVVFKYCCSARPDGFRSPEFDQAIVSPLSTSSRIECAFSTLPASDRDVPLRHWTRAPRPSHPCVLVNLRHP
ncbi:hypothetical protein C8R45DRAFT_1087093 [Mycena sanguinolenta]|nr:hypothetical protein C8R45DRAFT_1087093 [Mycena sanguinolenta]